MVAASTSLSLEGVGKVYTGEQCEASAFFAMAGEKSEIAYVEIV